MYDRTLAIYCSIEDLLKAMQHREDTRCQVSDAEIVTIALCAMLWLGFSLTQNIHIIWWESLS